MAYSRPIRATTAIRGASTAIDGMVSFTVETVIDFLFGRSDGQLGITSADMVGINTTVDMVLDADDEITAMANHAAEALTLRYRVQGGTARQRVIDSFLVENIGPLSVSAVQGSGETRQFGVRGRALLAAADTAYSSYMAVANQP